MATALQVEKQRFTFGDKWIAAFKYDDTKYYQRGPIQCQGELDGVGHGTKAVDVIALHSEAGLLLLEAKDFRGNRIQNKPRLKSGEIALEVALKIRDTIAGLIGAARQNVQEFDAVRIKNALNQGHDLLIVLWIEDDIARNPREWKQQLDVIAQALKAKLFWLEARFWVMSGTTPNRVPALTVVNLPGVGQP